MSQARYLFQAPEDDMAAYRIQATMDGMKFAPWLRQAAERMTTDEARIMALTGGGAAPGGGTDGNQPTPPAPPPVSTVIEKPGGEAVPSAAEEVQPPPVEDAKTRAARIRAASLARSTEGRCTADTPRGSRCKLCQKVH